MNEYFILATRPIKAVQIDEQKITITYRSNKETLIQARNFLTHTDDSPTPNIYQKKLAEIIANHDPEWRLSLAELLQPLFELAYQRSTLDNAIEENRIAIFTINEYVNKKEAKNLLAAPASANLRLSSNIPHFCINVSTWRNILSVRPRLPHR